MRRLITESDINRIIRRVLIEQETKMSPLDAMVDVYDILQKMSGGDGMFKIAKNVFLDDVKIEKKRSPYVWAQMGVSGVGKSAILIYPNDDKSIKIQLGTGKSGAGETTIPYSMDMSDVERRNSLLKGINNITRNL